METEARKKARTEFRRRKVRDGFRQVSVWIGPEAQRALDQIVGVHSSRDAAVEAAIIAYGRPPAPAAPKSEDVF